MRHPGTGLLVLAALACGTSPRPEATPAPAPAASEASLAVDEGSAADLLLGASAFDSAADLAALEALHELEFGSLTKGAEHVRGVVPFPTMGVADSDDITHEASRLFGAASRGGAASATAPVYDIDVESFASRARVQYYVDFFLGEARDRFTIWLERLNRYEGMIRSRFKQYGIPEDLVYLGLIESGYSNTAVSRARAVGMWQFITSTGRRYELEVSDWVDDRRDPFKATDAAARHLLDLNATFGSWYLAAAAYNGGAGRITRGIRRLPGSVDEVSDETFFALSDRRYLRPETRDYVPKLIAAALIAKEPQRFGFVNLSFLQPLVFDEVTVPDQTGLDVLARLADTTTGALVELNPQYHRGATPPRRSAVVRVPRGTGLRVAQRYAELPPAERVTFLDHVIRSGETLSVIARRYGISLRLLQAANAGLDPRRLKIGTRLVIPMSPAAGRSASRTRPRTAAAPAAPTPSRGAPRTPIPDGTEHVVRRGETLWLIAQRYGVQVSDLRRWNGIEGDQVILVGQRLLVAPPATPAGSR